MREMNELFEKLCNELCEYGQKDLTQDSLKTIDTLAHAAKNVLKVMEGCEGGSYAYYDEDPRTAAMGGSMRGSYGNGSYGNGSYNNGSYNNGSYRMSGKRDSMGRYSRAENNGISRTGYSRGNNVTDGLREIMYAAPQEMQGEIQRLIKKLDNM